MYRCASTAGLVSFLVGCVSHGPVCGDGVAEGWEACDHGDANADDGPCTTRCALAFCGDGLVGPSEACDDANVTDDDACRNDCHVCGDGIVGGRDRCDDGNDVDGDGCERCRLDGDPRRVFGAADPRGLHGDDVLHVFHQPLTGYWVSTYALDGSHVASHEGPLDPVGGGFAFTLDGDQPIIACVIDPDPTYAQGGAAHVARLDSSGAPVWISELPRPSIRDHESPGAIAVAGGLVAVAGTYTEQRAESIGVVSAFVDLLDGSGVSRYRATPRVRNENTASLAVDIDAAGAVAVGGLYLDFASGENRGWLAAIAREGTVLWLRELDTMVLAVALRGREVLAVTATDIQRYDAAGGAPLGTSALDVPPVVSWARFDHGQLLLFGGGAEAGIWISVHDEAGTLLWRAERDAMDPDGSRLLQNAHDGALASDGMLYVTDEAAIWVFDPHLP